MVFVFGILLVGSHLIVLISLAHLCAVFLPQFGMVVFLTFAFLSGLVLMKIQTWLEAYFIARHLRRNPHSGWNVVTRKRVRPRAEIVTPQPKAQTDRPGYAFGPQSATAALRAKMVAVRDTMRSRSEGADQSAITAVLRPQFKG